MFLNTPNESINSKQNEIKKYQTANDLLIIELEKKYWKNSPICIELIEKYKKARDKIDAEIKESREITQEQLNILKLANSNFERAKQWERWFFDIWADRLWGLARFAWLNSNSLWIELFKTTNQAQEDLIKEILKDDYKKWFNNKYLTWYNEKIWNFLISIEEFEANLKTTPINEINSKALSNYFLYLESKWILNLSTLTEKFWIIWIFKLSEQWANKINDSDPKKNIAKKTLEKKWILSKINQILNMTTNDDLASIIDNWKDDEIKLCELYLKENFKKLEGMLKNDFITKLIKANPSLEKDSNKIAEEFINEIKNANTNSKNENKKILEIIKKYNDSYKLNINFKKTLENAQNINLTSAKLEKISIKKRISELRKELEDAKEKKDNKKISEISVEIEKLKKYDKNASARISSLNIWKAITQNMSENQIKNMSKMTDLEYEKFTTNIILNDKKLSQEYKKLQDLKNDKINLPENKESKSYDFADSLSAMNLNFSQVNWQIKIILPTWEVTLNQTEYKLVKESKNALENIIKFKETLDKLNLSKLWDFRENIFKWVANKYMLKFNIKDDYLDDNELKIFLLTIIKSVWLKINNNAGLENIINEINKINNWDFIWKTKDNNKFWESKLEELFLNKFDKKRTKEFDEIWFNKSI